MERKYKIGIIGFGSIGERHLNNIIYVLSQRGIKWQIDLIRSGKGKQLDIAISKGVQNIYSYADRIPGDYDVLFVTNPTNLHYDTILRFLPNTQHMFIEKPIFDKTDVPIDLLDLKEDSIYYVACPLRYTNVIQFIKNEVDLQQIYCVRAISSSYLPEWRAGVDYRKTYSAHKDQGGGVTLDLIHEWDYLYHLFGPPKHTYNIKGKYSTLEIDSDDLSVYIAEYEHMLAEIHLDYFGRKSIREIQLFSREETIVGDLINSEIRYLKSNETITFAEQRDDYHRKEIAYFFDIIEGKAKNHNDISTALNVLRIAKGELL